MATKIYPVVHINSLKQGVEQAELALNCGADGVYLIDHHQNQQEDIISVFNALTDNNPNTYIGVNYLYEPSALHTLKLLQQAVKAEQMRRLPNALWADDVSDYINETLEYRKSDLALSKVRYLGGIAFKYTESYTDNHLIAAAEVRLLGKYVDVVTTSGPGTGKPPSPHKIAAMKQEADFLGKPLAVASGVSAENLSDYDGNIDEVLVSSSVETAPYSGVFIKSKLAELIEDAKKQP